MPAWQQWEWSLRLWNANPDDANTKLRGNNNIKVLKNISTFWLFMTNLLTASSSDKICDTPNLNHLGYLEHYLYSCSGDFLQLLDVSDSSLLLWEDHLLFVVV